MTQQELTKNKREYNELLKRYENAEKWMNKSTDEEFKKWEPHFLEIIIRLSELMKLIPDGSKEEFQNGFKEVHNG